MEIIQLEVCPAAGAVLAQQSEVIKPTVTLLNIYDVWGLQTALSEMLHWLSNLSSWPFECISTLEKMKLNWRNSDCSQYNNISPCLSVCLSPVISPDRKWGVTQLLSDISTTGPTAADIWSELEKTEFAWKEKWIRCTTRDQPTVGQSDI